MALNIENDWSIANFTQTQKIAIKYLFDKTTTEVLFGGAAGGGKSFVGCSWLILMCLKNPKTRYLMGRSKLDSLKTHRSNKKKKKNDKIIRIGYLVIIFQILK